MLLITLTKAINTPIILITYKIYTFYLKTPPFPYLLAYKLYNHIIPYKIPKTEDIPSVIFSIRIADERI